MDKQQAKQAARHALIAAGLTAAIGIAVAAHPLPDGRIADTTSGPTITNVDYSPTSSAWEWLDRAHETGEEWREAGEKREHGHEQKEVLEEADTMRHGARTEQTPDAVKGEWDI